MRVLRRIALISSGCQESAEREVSERVGGDRRLRHLMPVAREALARRQMLRGVQLKYTRAALSQPDADLEGTA